MEEHAPSGDKCPGSLSYRGLCPCAYHLQMAILRRTGRTQALPRTHGGWTLRRGGVGCYFLQSVQWPREGTTSLSNSGLLFQLPHFYDSVLCESAKGLMLGPFPPLKCAAASPLSVLLSPSSIKLTFHLWCGRRLPRVSMGTWTVAQRQAEVSDWVSAVGRLPSITAAVSLPLPTILCQHSASYIQGPPMGSEDELVELSTESFPGSSNRMFFLPGHLSLSPSHAHTYRGEELTLNLGCHSVLLLGKKNHLSKEQWDMWRLMSCKSITIEDDDVGKRHIVIALSWPWFCWLLLTRSGWGCSVCWRWVEQPCETRFFCLIRSVFSLDDVQSGSSRCTVRIVVVLGDVSRSVMLSRWSIRFSKWLIGHQSLSEEVLRNPEVSCCSS